MIAELAEQLPAAHAAGHAYADNQTPPAWEEAGAFPDPGRSGARRV